VAGDPGAAYAHRRRDLGRRSLSIGMDRALGVARLMNLLAGSSANRRQPPDSVRNLA
jgi:hypothetical protein